MRAWRFIVVLIGLSLLTGCSGVVKTPGERNNTLLRVMDMDARQLADDWDSFWLIDRQYRLTRWHTR